MKQSYVFWIVISLALVTPLPAADENPSQWLGVWEISQTTDSGPVTLRLQVPARGRLELMGASWEPLVLADASLEVDRLVFNWTAKGTNLVFRGERTGNRVAGTWELVHPQYRTTNTFSGRRLVETPQWKPLQALEGDVIPLVLDLNARLREQGAEFKTYWNEGFYSDYLPLLIDPPGTEALEKALADPKLTKQGEEFSRIIKDLAERVETKLPGTTLPYHFVALPYGPSRPRAVQVGKRAFLVANATSMIEANRPDPEVTVPLAFLRSSFERYLFTVAQPFVESFRAGLPLYLFSRLYPGKVHQAIGISAERLAQLEGGLDALKQRLQAGETLETEEREIVDYHFARFLAQSRTPQQLIELSPQTLSKEYKSFLAE